MLSLSLYLSQLKDYFPSSRMLLSAFKTLRRGGEKGN